MRSEAGGGGCLNCGGERPRGRLFCQPCALRLPAHRIHEMLRDHVRAARTVRPPESGLLVRGGQGRSAAEIEDDARGAMWMALVGVVAVAVLAAVAVVRTLWGA